ncbi:hypothetical protein [Rickettsiales endosymbiont of Stachyamoeba lipophora]|nr:hypothetical protein [Rickettsiales endosymbiont of Stachyamoeba lipophora]
MPARKEAVSNVGKAGLSPIAVVASLKTQLAIEELGMNNNSYIKKNH